jgi:hypothetical protein
MRNLLVGDMLIRNLSGLPVVKAKRRVRDHIKRDERITRA